MTSVANVSGKGKSRLQYLKIRKGNQVRADGSVYAVPLFVNKTRKYGKTIEEKSISRKTPILVTGAHDSGKTRWLNRLYEDAMPIWGAKHKHDPLWLGALRPLAAWCDAPCVEQWWERCREEEERELDATTNPATNPTTTATRSKAKPKTPKTTTKTKTTKPKQQGRAQPRRPWTSLKQWERSEVLPDYCRDTNAVLFIDDAHKLAGRKLEIARLCVLASRIHVIAASEEQRIPPNLRSVLMRRDPQVFRLDSEVAYDATSLLMWLFICISMGAGLWEISLVLGGLKALGNGRRSARPD